MQVEKPRVALFQTLFSVLPPTFCKSSLSVDLWKTFATDLRPVTTDKHRLDTDLVAFSSWGRMKFHVKFDYISLVIFDTADVQSSKCSNFAKMHRGSIKAKIGSPSKCILTRLSSCRTSSLAKRNRHTPSGFLKRKEKLFLIKGSRDVATKSGESL